MLALGAYNVTAYFGGGAPGPVVLLPDLVYRNSTSNTSTLTIAASSLSSGSTTCSGSFTGRGASVVVPANGVCTLVAGTISGDVTVNTGGTLILQNVTIGHDIQANNPAAVAISGSTIGHDIQLTGPKGPNKGDNFICQTHVGHDLVVKSGPATASRLVIGGAPDCASPGGGNTISHDLVVQSNQEPVVVAANTVSHNLTVQSNTPGGATVIGNSVGFDAVCSANNPQSGSGNTGAHSNSCPH